MAGRNQLDMQREPLLPLSGQRPDRKAEPFPAGRDQFLDLAAPMWHKCMDSLKSTSKSYVLCDPDMWTYVRRQLDEAFDLYWDELQSELTKNIRMAYIPPKVQADNEGPTCGRCHCIFGWLCKVRAFFLHHYLPHDKTFFGKFKDKWWILMYVVTLIPVHGLRVVFFGILLLLIIFPGPPDEYAIINFILVFKGSQFLSQGVISMSVGSLEYFSCYSSHKDDLLHCMDNTIPSSSGLKGQVVDFFGSCLLTWVAFWVLPYTHQHAVSQVPGKEFSYEEQDDSHHKQGPHSCSPCGRLFCCCRCSKPVDDRGGRLRRMLKYDFTIFTLSVLLQVYLLIDIDAIRTLDEHKQFSAITRHQLEANLYWCKVFYAIFSLPFFFYQLPPIQQILTHSDPTGYNKFGACVRLELPREDRHQEDADRKHFGLGRQLSKVSKVLQIMNKGKAAAGRDANASYSWQDFRLGVWSEAKEQVGNSWSQGRERITGFFSKLAPLQSDFSPSSTEAQLEGQPVLPSLIQVLREETRWRLRPETRKELLYCVEVSSRALSSRHPSASCGFGSYRVMRTGGELEELLGRNRFASPQVLLELGGVQQLDCEILRARCEDYGRQLQGLLKFLHEGGQSVDPRASNRLVQLLTHDGSYERERMPDSRPCFRECDTLPLPEKIGRLADQLACYVEKPASNRTKKNRSLGRQLFGDRVMRKNVRFVTIEPANPGFFERRDKADLIKPTDGISPRIAPAEEASPASNGVASMRSRSNPEPRATTPVPQAAIPKGVYKLKSFKSNKYLNIAPGKPRNGTNVDCWNYHSASSLWEISEVDLGRYTLKNLKSGKFLNVDENTRNVQIWDTPDVADSQWELDVLQDGAYRFKNVANGMYLAMTGQFDEEANVEVTDRHDHVSSSWRLQNHRLFDPHAWREGRLAWYTSEAAALGGKEPPRGCLPLEHIIEVKYLDEEEHGPCVYVRFQEVSESSGLLVQESELLLCHASKKDAQSWHAILNELRALLPKKQQLLPPAERLNVRPRDPSPLLLEEDTGDLRALCTSLPQSWQEFRWCAAAPGPEVLNQPRLVLPCCPDRPRTQVPVPTTSWRDDDGGPWEDYAGAELEAGLATEALVSWRAGGESFASEPDDSPVSSVGNSTRRNSS